MSARAEILARIRSAQGKTATVDAGERDAVTGYIRERPMSPRPALRADAVIQFRERVVSLASTFDSIRTVESLPDAVARYLLANGLPMTAVCWPEFAGLAWSASGLRVEARNATGEDLVGITGAFCGIAETGTLMLLSGSATPAAVSLLPETHISVIRRSRIVRGMEEGWQRLREEARALPRAVNFISGPSRTADIEQTVTLGAHGPYRVHVIQVDDGE